MKRIVISLMILFTGMTATIDAQTSTDSLTRGARSFVARNFSEARTFNLYWETTPSHDYTLMQNGNEIENGKFRNINTVKFSATVPVLLLKNFSLYANGQFNSYQFASTESVSETPSTIFSKNEGGYNFYEGSITGTYRTRIGSKPIILIVSGLGDGWEKGFEKAHGMFSAIMVFKQSPTTSFSAGLLGMTLYDKIPLVPVITYWHQFSQAEY